MIYIINFREDTLFFLIDRTHFKSTQLIYFSIVFMTLIFDIALMRF